MIFQNLAPRCPGAVDSITRSRKSTEYGFGIVPPGSESMPSHSRMDDPSGICPDSTQTENALRCVLQIEAEDFPMAASVKIFIPFSFAIATAAALVFFQPSQPRAADWPNKAVHLIVPYPPGGNADVVGRVAARALQAELGQPFVIENKAGAGGLIGAEAVARSAPDGYTFLLSANGPVLYAPELAARKPYEWRKDFVPVGTISLTSMVLVAHPSVPAKTLPEFLDLARRDGAKLVFGVGGIGTSYHLFSELMQSELNLKWTTAQYKGSAPAMNDLIGGHVQFSIDQISAALPLVRDGRVRPLAVSGLRRVQWLPGVPTFVERGYKDLQGYTFAAILAPAGTPDDIVQKLSAALKKAVLDRQVRDQIETLGAEPEAMSPAEFRAYLDKEDATWLPLVRRVGPPQ